MMTHILAHNPAGLLNALTGTLILGLFLVPLSYIGISLLGFMLGSIGSGRGFLRAGLSAIFCSLLVFLLIAPAGIWLQFSYGGSEPMAQPEWLVCCKSLLLILTVATPALVGHYFTGLSWLRVTLITLGITIAMSCIVALLFAFGVFMAVMSQM